MDRASFFRQFELMADLPQAVQRLREMVLQLAVQGRLVPQDPNDEPASVLLERVRRARRQLAEEGRVKTKVQIPVIESEDDPYPIPDTWLWVPLNELTELVYGKLLPRTKLLPVGFPVFGANGIIGNYSRYHYEDEMLLISCRGAYSGKPNISPVKCYVTNNSIVCEFFEPTACDIRFYHAVISISPREKIVTGSAQPQVTVANAIKLPVPLPPLAEQKRIVAKMDELMALCDELERRQQARGEVRAQLQKSALHHLVEARDPQTFAPHWHRVRDNFHLLHETPESVPELRQTILQLAVQGRLVPQDQKDEPADVLLSEVQKVRGQVAREQSLKLPDPEKPISNEDITFDLPSGWTVAKLGDVCLKLGAGSTPLGGRRVYEKSGIKFLRSQNIWNNGLQLNDVAYISEATHERMNGTSVQPGDILLNITGASIGRCAVVPDDFDAANVSQHVTIVRLANVSLRKFVHLCIIAPDFQERIMRVQVGVSREGLSMTRLKEFVLAIPPLAEQKRIIAKVEKLMHLCDELEAKLAESKALGEQLLESTVHHLLAS